MLPLLSNIYSVEPHAMFIASIRSANVAASVKQHGMISLKDAQSFNVIEPGKIHKEDLGWVIENPVVVEFVK